jgi:dTDP-4-amino-4,6-dideoxygalactose transaminase
VVDANRRNYDAYRVALAGIPGVRLLTYDEAEKNNYQYIVMEVDPECAAGRDEIVAGLHAENVLARKYFWPGCHLMEPYRSLYPHAGLMLPNTQAVAERVVVLPTGSSLQEADCELIGRIIAALVAYGLERK